MSPYVAHLRSLVGDYPLHLPTVSLLCRDDKDRLLVIRHSESGRWSVPGGAIEPGETPELAAIREAKEETGFDVRLDRLRCALGGPDYWTEYANGDRLTYVSLMYEATIVGGEATPDGAETSAVAFMEVEALAELDKERFLTLVLRDGVIG